MKDQRIDEKIIYRISSKTTSNPDEFPCIRVTASNICIFSQAEQGSASREVS